GSTIFNAILAIEELARVDASVSVFVDVHNTLVTNAFMRWANDDQKKKYLTQMASGKVGAYALSEAGSGSDAFALKTRAVGKGYKVSIETLNEGRIGIAAQMLGIAQGAYEAALKYTAEREQFGSSLNSFQAVQFQLAEMAVEIEATRLLVYNAARLKDAGKPFLKEAAMAKLFSSRCAERVSSKAIELFGGYGYVKDYPVEKFWRDSKIGSIYEGTSNMQLQTIAKLITK